MTRKDYILIAEEFREKRIGIAEDANQLVSDSLDEEYLKGFDVALDCLMDALESDNPRFDREHFLAVVRGERELNSRPSHKRV